MSVLQDGEEHCISCVRIVGFGVEGVEESICCWRRRAHAPSCGQACADSVRWFRQYVL